MNASMTVRRTRPSLLSSLESIVKDCKAWLNAESQTFTAICGEDKEVYTHMDVLKANAALLIVLIIVGVAGSL
ncbi:MAG: hypothetical protein K5683_02795 [Prevotella sp.]|nr:hypothetical protein [Prevotella sp.]